MGVGFRPAPSQAETCLRIVVGESNVWGRKYPGPVIRVAAKVPRGRGRGRLILGPKLKGLEGDVSPARQPRVAGARVGALGHIERAQPVVVRAPHSAPASKGTNKYRSGGGERLRRTPKCCAPHRTLNLYAYSRSSDHSRDLPDHRTIKLWKRNAP